MKSFINILLPLFLLTFTQLSFGQNFNEDMKQAMKFESQGKYAEAATLFEYWLPGAKTYGDNDSSLYYKMVSMAGGWFEQAGEYEKAEPLMKETIRINKEFLGENDPEYAESLNHLAKLYQDMSEYEQAEPLMKEAIKINKAYFGENHPAYGISLNYLAELYQLTYRYKESEPLRIDALRIAKETIGENNPIYATHLNNLAELYKYMGRYQEAQPLIKEATRIDKDSFGVNHITYGTDLSNLARLYRAMGQYEKAETLMIQAVQIAKETYGINHPEYSFYLNNLAQIYHDMSKYDQAEPMIKEALRISKDCFGENNPFYSTDINNLAQLYHDMGRYEHAESLMHEAMQIDKESLGENHPSYIRDLSNLARLYIDMGRFEQSEILMKDVIRIARGTIGENHPDYGTYLNNLAQLFIFMGRYEQAEPLMKATLEIDKISLGENHPTYSRDLNNLAMLYLETDRNADAEHLMMEVINIDKLSLAENNSEYSAHLNNLASIYKSMGHYEKADSLMKVAYLILRNNFENNSGYLSETELSQFQETFIFNLRVYQSFNHQQTVLCKKKGDFALDIELYQKGLLLNSVIETRRCIFNSGDTSLINSFQTMMAYRKQADKLYSIPIEQRYEDPAMLETKANELEKDLKLRSKEYSRSLEDADINWKQVQDKLNPDEAVVEFASFPYYNKQWTDSTLYCALVLRKQDTVPHMIYLFEEKQLSEAIPKPENNSDAAINNTYATLRGTQLVPDSSWYQGENLYTLVWKPLDSLLSGIKTVSFACSGLLNMVSFAAIPDATGKLLCDKYLLNQYSSTRNLAIETNDLPITDAIIYGGIQYELDTTLMIANARQYSKTNDYTLAYNSTRSGNKRGNGFDDLEGTREEANSLKALFNEKKITTNNYTGAAANEESFKAMAGKKSPSVIHLSTHGFYYPDTNAQRKQAGELQFIGSDLNRFQYSPDPLLRSGIVLAGANRVWRGEPVPDGVEDGILTAKDVSQLNLSNTQLVVLSACQTGLGDVKGNEGVFGLQRAFKMAGVKYLMMSLWSVPDKETKEFMEKFYAHWLSGIPIRSAFQTTQQEMRLEYPKEPYKWAAFVLVE